MHSVRYKITAITIISILLTVLAVAYTAYSAIGAENDKTSAEMMYLTCETTGKTLDDYLDGIEQSLDMAAYIAMDSLDSVALVEGGVAGTYAKNTKRTPEQIKEESYKCINAAGADGRFILAAGCEVPKDTPIQNIQALVMAAKSYTF